MEKTINYNLKKPSLTDNVLITDLNENADIIDAKIKEIDTKVVSSLADYSQHKVNEMPHKFVDGIKTYKWGFRTLNGQPQFIYEEVI